MAFRSVKSGHFISEARWRQERAQLDAQVTRLGRLAHQHIVAREKVKTKAAYQRHHKKVQQLVAKQRAAIAKRAKAEQQGDRISKGRTLEITYRTHYRAPHKLRMLKVRAKVTGKKVTQAEVERAVETAIRQGKPTKGVQLEVADWEGGKLKKLGGGQEKVTRARGSFSGTATDSIEKQLHGFVGAMRAGKLLRKEGKK